MLNKFIKWLIILVILGLIGVILYFWHENQLQNQEIESLKNDESNIIKVGSGDENNNTKITKESENNIPLVMPAQMKKKESVDEVVDEKNELSSDASNALNTATSGRLRDKTQNTVADTFDGDWKVYENDTFGVKVNYSEDFELDSGDNQKISFKNIQGIEFWCGKLQHTACSAPHLEIEKVSVGSLDEYIANILAQSPDGIVVKSDLTIDGRKSKRVTFPGMEEREGYLIENDGNVVIISGGSLNPKEEFKIDKVIEIVSLKFL